MKQNRDKNNRDKKTFFSFFERAKNQLISLITQQKKMNAFVRQKKRHTQEIKK